MPKTHLKQTCLSYLDFMTEVGSTGDTASYAVTLKQLFAENIAKIENGKQILEGHEQLAKQLENAKNYAFPWKMDLLDITCDNDNGSAVIRFTWNSEKVGKHITAALLRVNENNKIIGINEVYTEFAGISH